VCTAIYCTFTGHGIVLKGMVWYYRSGDANGLTTEHTAPAYCEKPREGSIIPDIAAAYIHINDWAFLNSHGYVNISGSKEREAQYRYTCLFYLRKRGENTCNYRQISKKDQQKVNTHI
jgi:hypothetical protein